MIDSEWPLLNAAFEAWLSPDNFDAEGNQKPPAAGYSRRPRQRKRLRTSRGKAGLAGNRRGRHPARRRPRSSSPADHRAVARQYSPWLGVVVGVCLRARLLPGLLAARALSAEPGLKLSLSLQRGAEQQRRPCNDQHGAEDFDGVADPDRGRRAAAGEAHGQTLGGDGKGCQHGDGDRGAERHGEDREHAAEIEPVQQREGQHQQRAGAGAKADGDDGRPGLADAERRPLPSMAGSGTWAWPQVSQTMPGMNRCPACSACVASKAWRLCRCGVIILPVEIMLTRTGRRRHDMAARHAACIERSLRNSSQTPKRMTMTKLAISSALRRRPSA